MAHCNMPPCPPAPAPAPGRPHTSACPCLACASRPHRSFHYRTQHAGAAHDDGAEINTHQRENGKGCPSVRAGDPAVTTARGGGENERWIMDVPLPPAAAAAACAREPPRPRRQPLECGSPFRLLIETKKKVTFSRPGRCAGENESLANPPLELGYSPVVCCILNPDKAKTRPRSHGKPPARHSKVLAHTFCELNNVPSRPLEDPETLRLACVMLSEP